MEEFLYQCSHSIPDELCKDIITQFEKENLNQNQNVSAMEYTISIDIDKSSKWHKLKEFLIKELTNHLQKYKTNICQKCIKENDNGITKYFHKQFINHHFTIKKYTELTQSSYHNDFQIKNTEKRSSSITYLWYLNNIEKGGETEFWGDYTVQPEEGKIILFPASWTFPYIDTSCANKYIISGILYID